MANRIAVWRGATGMKEDPSSPVVGSNKDGVTLTRIWNGPYATVKASVPARLSIVAGSPGVFVDTTRLEKLTGDRGRLTVELSSNPFPDPDSDVLELEWVEIQKPLLQHKRYQPGGVKALSDSDLDAIEEWKNAATAAARGVAYGKLTANAKDFADKFKRGTESFVIYAPVARVTTRSVARPACGRCGMISDPPSDAKPAGSYVYLKTADRRTRQDRMWARAQEWTGGDAVDADIYPTS